MGVIRKCLECGRVYNVEEYSADKTLTRTVAGSPSFRAAAQGNVVNYDSPKAAGKVVICPYCGSDHTKPGKGMDFIKAVKDKYAAGEKLDDVHYYAKVIPNIFAGIDASVLAKEEIIRYVSGDCEERIRKMIMDIGDFKDLSLESIRANAEPYFTKPYIVHETATDKWYLLEKDNIIFAYCAQDESYSSDGGQFGALTSEIVEIFKKRIEKILDYNYSFVAEV